MFHRSMRVSLLVSCHPSLTYLREAHLTVASTLCQTGFLQTLTHWTFQTLSRRRVEHSELWETAAAAPVRRLQFGGSSSAAPVLLLQFGASSSAARWQPVGKRYEKGAKVLEQIVLPPAPTRPQNHRPGFLGTRTGRVKHRVQKEAGVTMQHLPKAHKAAFSWAARPSQPAHNYLDKTH